MGKKTLKILVVDDTEANVRLLEGFISRQGHEVISAVNGREAIEVFEREKPDLVLMDVMMPEMDGYEATQKIREICGDQWIPIVFMSAKVSVDDQVKGLDAGGDDYLLKPVNLKIMSAKINAMQRIAELRDVLVTQAQELSRYHQMAEEEKVLATELMEHMTAAGKFTDDTLETWVMPAERMSGDLIAASQTDDGRLYVMLADATGHGLLAAIMQLPVSLVFYRMASQGFSLTSIIVEMNRQVRKLVPRDRFVAATLVMVDQRNHLFEIWNGGSPEALYISDGSQIRERFVSQAAPLGVLPQEDFMPHTRVYQWQTPGELVIYSDGIIDALDPDQEPLGMEGLERALLQADGKSAVSVLPGELEQHLQGLHAHDDVSVVSIKCLPGKS